jgi:hypothetical protein
VISSGNFGIRIITNILKPIFEALPSLKPKHLNKDAGFLYFMGSRLYSKRLMHRRNKPKYGRDRLKRQKTFKTEAGAKKWAEENKIKEYKLVNLKEEKKENKIRVVY